MRVGTIKWNVVLSGVESLKIGYTIKIDLKIILHLKFAVLYTNLKIFLYQKYVDIQNRNVLVLYNRFRFYAQ